MALAMAVKWITIFTALLHVVGAQDPVVCRPASDGRLKNINDTFNATKFPPSLFRSDKGMAYFRVWPENISRPHFRFPCQDGSSTFTLPNFTATCDQTTGRLDPRPYYDVGLADSLRPYYKHWTYTEILPKTDVQLLCERDDMRRLYSYRIWRKTIIPAVVTTIVLLVILESAALVAAFLCFWALTRSRPLLQLPDLGFEDTVADCVHLLLLIVAGFTMIEGVSHSSSASWRSTCMLDAAVIYTYLTLFAIISSLLRQVASACIHRDTSATKTTPQPTTSGMGTPAKAGQEADEGVGLEQKGNEWRWQRVFTQFAVVILMTAFLSYNENAAGTALDALVSVVWSIAVTAGAWSIGVSVVIAARAVTELGKMSSPWWCWRPSQTPPQTPRP